MEIPENLQYTADHEWVSLEGEIATVGITAHATAELGDIVFLDLPDIGDELTAGEAAGEIESTKSVSDLISPLTGDVTEINEAALENPSLVNSAPYTDGWLYKITVSAEETELLSAEEYRHLLIGGN
ncbi:glycine cleavage system protein H [Actinobaculum suis]|uniref:Glycine cleavage system H protein n=1 Tax=Actinobaculum suis TaxID=1657 RepID=A0A7Z8Y8P5_9ACTO|nr:glycine cleavage system protein GcvH [Actinobaculum suis]VDG76327.1 glycine cleavage system protein H [Actinobaculum suis]